MVDLMQKGGIIVKELQFALRDGMGGLKLIPGLVKMVVRENFWHERNVAQLGSVVKFESFSAFVTGELPQGLDTDIDTIKRLCEKDKEALDLIDRAIQNPNGGDRKSTDYISVYDIHTDNTHTDRPAGTSAAASIRRLRKDRPDLHQSVIAGDLSPHAAAIQAGFRRRTFTVPVDVAAAARAIAKHFTKEEQNEIARLLVKYRPGQSQDNPDIAGVALDDERVL